VKKTAIGITCIGSLLGQGIVKSIKKSSLANEISIIGFEYFSGTISSYWVDPVHIMPDILKPDVSEDSYIETLITHIRNHEIKILFIGMDFELSMMAKYKQRIYEKSKCIVVVSGAEVIEISNDKYKTYNFLKRNSLYYPKTWLPAEVDEVIYPVIVKPRIGERSRGVSVVKNRADLGKALTGIKNPIIQEKIGSRDMEYTCGLIFLDGKIKTNICLRRNLRDGNTSVAYHSTDTPACIYSYVEKIAKLLEPFGPCNFQLRTDKEGIPKLFEINARFSGTTPIRALFGLNEVEYVISYLINRKESSFDLRYGKVIRYMEEKYIPGDK
jgi:carbamoyl-phosphate synthase large subunit